ncbi:MAG: hypothetical protein ACJ76J_20230 [Thermoanaerobaculia bacterium]
MKSKRFDAVQLMRQTRDEMGAKLQDMSFEEQKAFIERQASKVRREIAQGKPTQASRPRAGAGAPGR